MHLMRIGLNGHVFLVGCPSQPVVFHDCYAPDDDEDSLEGLVLIGERFYESYEVIALAYSGQRGFKMISAA